MGCLNYESSDNLRASGYTSETPGTTKSVRKVLELSYLTETDKSEFDIIIKESLGKHKERLKNQSKSAETDFLLKRSSFGRVADAFLRVSLIVM